MPERDWGAILRRAVRFADWPVSKPLGPGALYGLAAYDAWADTLRMGPDEQGADADIHLHVPVTSMVAAARKAAAKALSEDASLHEAFAEAAEHYLAEVQVLEQMNTVLAGGQGGGDWNAMLKAMAENLEAGTAGEAGAQVIEQARAEEEQAVDALRRALRDLGPAGAPRADARPPEPAATAAPVAPAAKPGEAEVLYEHGVEQKRAGNLKDAVVLLRAAIAADPKLVRAHYALAWVLKDQQDIEGAAAEFRKVVELSPDSAEAQESKKALERMGQ
jgi:tetratricopeptide (TPR) repeat protein